MSATETSQWFPTRCPEWWFCVGRPVNMGALTYDPSKPVTEQIKTIIKVLSGRNMNVFVW